MDEPTMTIDNFGTKHWYLNGKHHRENEPAVEYNNGTKYWYLNGEHHREDGPAIEYGDGTKYWCLNDKKYSEEKYKIQMRKRKLELMGL